MKLRYPLTGDILTMTALFNRASAFSIRESCGYTPGEVRMLMMAVQTPGMELDEMSQRAGIQKSRVSLCISRLQQDGLVRKERKNRKVTVAATPRGEHVIVDCRSALEAAYDHLLEPLSANEKQAFEAGCMVSSSKFNDFYYADGKPDKAGSLFAEFLRTEQYSKQYTQRFGLTLSEFRILFQLYEFEGALTSAQLMRALFISRATTSDAVRSLSDKAYVQRLEIDGKSNTVSLAEPVPDAFVEAAQLLDDFMIDGFRHSPLDTGERLFFCKASSKIVDCVRNRHKKRRAG